MLTLKRIEKQMKKIIYILLITVFFSCDSEDAGDCLQTAGGIVKVTVDVPNFNEIVVHENVELIVIDGPTQKVEIETGENLLNDIRVEVIDKQLVLNNDNNCNFFRGYNLTKVYVTSPDINTIRNASELNVSSIGALTYPSLYLRSAGEDGVFLSVGDFNLTIENDNVIIVSNGIANFYIDGHTDKLNVIFSDGDTRFEGQNFIVKNITLRNVSSNDILLHPTESVSGTIHSTGDVILYNTPPLVDVEELSVGKLIYN